VKPCCWLLILRLVITVAVSTFALTIRKRGIREFIIELETGFPARIATVTYDYVPIPTYCT
jgi:hypothetical protein